MPDDATKVNLRRQALEWLEAELAIWKQISTENDPAANERVAKTMAHWKADSDLAGIRDSSELEKLPEDERKEFNTLWNEVDQLLAKASK